MTKSGLSAEELAALSSQLNPVRTIKLPGGGSFDLHGIDLDDALAIYQRHAGELSTWFDRLVLQTAEAGEATFSFDGAIASALLDGAPTIAAEIIARAMGHDDPAVVGIVKNMPLSPKVAALQAVADLTFTEDMPPKKMFEIFIQALGIVPTPQPSGQA